MTALILALGLGARALASTFEEDKFTLINMSEDSRTVADEAAPLLIQLDALAGNYGPETDLRAAGERRLALRARLKTLAEDLARLRSDYLRMRPDIVDKYGPTKVKMVIAKPGWRDSGLERLARAETALSSSLHLQYSLAGALDREERAFRVCQGTAFQQGRRRKILALAGALALLVGAAGFLILRRPRPPPKRPPPPPRFEIIDLRPK